MECGSIMEPSCSHTDDRITLQTQPKRSNSRLSSSSSQRAKMVKLRLEQLAKDLCLIGDRMSVWSLLPINLLIAIFKLLSVYDRARCSCVCKHWKTVYHMPDLWHQFVFEFHQTTTMSKSTPIMLIRQIFEKHTKDIKCVIIKVDGFQQSVDAACSVLTQLVHCPIHSLQLSSITGQELRSAQSHKFVKALKGIFVNSDLKSLNIEETPIDDELMAVLATKSQATLGCLRLSNCPMISAAGIASAIDNCSHLYELIIDYTHMSKALLQALCSSTHHKVKHLSVNVTEQDEHMNTQTIPWQSIGSDTWDLLAHHYPEIKFSLQFYAIKEEFYHHFFCSMMPLTSLSFGCLVPKIILSRVATQCTRLTELYIANSGNEPINEEILKIARRCPHLKVLELGNCLMKCYAVVELAKLCGPRLSKLVIHEEASLESQDCDIKTMVSQVSSYMQRTWNVEYIPIWFE
ncbi:F-box/LRR-repeat protein 3-like [Asterias rubens]|uniref:F-box/LRR-repeat protein 3-like n=1 Tax=Asterias rubens TaxID=7604 RepID=UPI001454EA89|nr:F-box/LRR-repeat protein 3-like [Asterias rubens]XP_033632243.1 F-box/LRR-repeat protein 3-like [Asterias rubens]XP_033632244.1 F-box/LRR-repeat protein 3-like [Asterias rubens]XP_033632245.1 F-box/LRR-repeat protein 3-like [Asterias rubens]